MTAVDHVPARSRGSRAVIVAALASLGLLLGWAAPVGAHAASVRPAPSTASASIVGQASGTVARVTRSALAGATVRSVQRGAVAQRAVRGTVGSDNSLPLAALLVTTLGLAAVLGRALPLARTSAATRVGHANNRRDRAPPVLAPTAA